MKALALKSAGHAGVVDIPEPVPSPGDLLLKPAYVGLCGSDLNSFRGRNPLVSYPRVLGHEVAATVVEGSAAIPAGAHVTFSPYTACGVCSACRNGRSNACRNNRTMGVQRDGALAEWVVVPEEKVYPSSLPLRDLCLTEPLTVGFHAAARGRVTAKDTVVVLGCGGVGLGAIAGAAFRGARVIAADVDDAKLDVARKSGAQETLNTRSGDTVRALADLTAGEGPDVVIEAIGLPATFQLAVEAVAFTGRVVYIGYAKEPVTYETRFFVQKELDILGSRNAQSADFRDVIAMLESGRFPVNEAISATFDFEDAPEALQTWSENPTGFTKILIQVS